MHISMLDFTVCPPNPITTICISSQYVLLFLGSSSYNSAFNPTPLLHCISVRLLSAVLRTSEVESRATRASLTELLSPQMGKDIVWFLRRWAKTYLLVDEKLYEQVCFYIVH